MKVLKISIGGLTGSVFEGELPQTYCFVPEYCLVKEDGRLVVAEGDYMRSGWDVRNMRFNDAGEGQHLFPNTQRPIADLDVESVRIFLNRIDSVHAA
jgi:hypothetical protein